MSIAIDAQKCVGCGQCIEVCPGNLIERSPAGKAVIRYPRDCWGCACCVKECKALAIDFFLGADIGGRGTRLHVTQAGDLLSWTIIRASGKQQTISVNRTESNQY